MKEILQEQNKNNNNNMKKTYIDIPENLNHHQRGIFSYVEKQQNYKK